MTSEELENIVRKHEMQRLELKESFNTECIETACAFANAGGGFIFIGIDNDGNPSAHQLRVEGLRDYENKIATATEPSVAVDAEKAEFRGREVVILKVAENPLKPVATKGRCFIRKGSVNHQMTPTEIAECHLKSTGSSMDAVFMPDATKDDLDMDTVRRYMRKANAENRRAFAPEDDPWSVLVKLGLVKSENEITRAAYLLFAKDPQQRFSQAVIHAGAFKAEGAVIIDSHDSSGNIQEQVEDALAFIKRNIRCAIVVTGKAEHDRYWEYPVEGMREALANAVCHRDYGMSGNIQVKVFEDRVVIVNPGALPFDMSLEQLEDPDHSSRPRNKLIAQVFYDLHIIEQYGSGIRRIKSDCDRNGSPYPILKNGNGEFCVKFLARTSESVTKLGFDPEKIGFKDAESTKEPSPIGAERAEKTAERAEKTAERAEKIRDWAYTVIPSGVRQDARSNMVSILQEIGMDKFATTEKLMQATGLSDRGVRKIVASLKDLGVLVRIGPDKGGHWEIAVVDGV